MWRPQAGPAWYNLAAPTEPGATVRRGMSKKFQSTALLFLIGFGFGIFSLVSLKNAQSGDDVIQALLYMIPAVAAFVALFKLPSRQTS